MLELPSERYLVELGDHRINPSAPKSVSPTRARILAPLCNRVSFHSSISSALTQHCMRGSSANAIPHSRSCRKRRFEQCRSLVAVARLARARACALTARRVASQGRGAMRGVHIVNASANGRSALLPALEVVAKTHQVAIELPYHSVPLPTNYLVFRRMDENLVATTGRGASSRILRAGTKNHVHGMSLLVPIHTNLLSLPRSLFFSRCSHSARASAVSPESDYITARPGRQAAALRNVAERLSHHGAASLTRALLAAQRKHLAGQKTCAPAGGFLSSL